MGVHVCIPFFFLLSALLRELGSLCWDRGYGAIESTRDAALLGSSRAGTDQTHVAGVVKLDVIQGEKLRVDAERHHKSWRRFNLGCQLLGTRNKLQSYLSY